MKKLISLVFAFLIVFITSCQSQISQEKLEEIVQSTINSFTPIPTFTSQPTYTPLPSFTPFPTLTPAPTQTPWIKIVTPTNTFTPEFTPTNTIPPTATATKTPLPGIGSDIKCGNYFTIRVTEKPIPAEYVYGERSNGLFYIIKFSITNNSTSTYQIWDDYFFIEGVLDGKDFLYEVHSDASWEMYWASRYSVNNLSDEIGGGLSSSRIVVFDVNPDLKELTFLFEPKDNMFDSKPLCQAKIPLE
ncbi:MAG: hypothetical protein CL609_09670 [Anaerolineaceae bacterium]|nr:hypothetical protein [Anaerolineaceae bacterium]